MNRRLALVTALTATLGLISCSTSSGTPSSSTSARSTITVGSTLEPPTLDPTKSSAAAIPEVLRDNVLQGLVRLDDGGNVQPQLATSWDLSANNTVYTFHLVTGATWHDGSPFTAKDVVFTLMHDADPATNHPFKAQFKVIDSVTAPDDHTVKVALKQYSANFLFDLGLGEGVVYQQKNLSQLASDPIGTGPFRFDHWVHGDSITLLRYDGYWRSKARVQKVVFKYITDANAMNNALLSNDLDVISRVTGPEQLPAFVGNSKYKVFQGLSTSKVIISLNNSDGALADLRVRQAISFAIDRKAVIDGSQSGYGVPIGTHAVPGDPYYVDLTGVYAHDPAKARQLLAEAGHASDLSFTLTLPPPPYAQRGGEIIASELEAVGIKVNLVSVDFPRWLSDVFGNGQFDMTIIAHVEPRDIAQFGNPQYYWHYDSPAVQQLLKQADAEPDASTRNQLYQQVEHQITADAVDVWLYVLPSLAVTRSDVAGYPKNRLMSGIDMSGVYVTSS